MNSIEISKEKIDIADKINVDLDAAKISAKTVMDHFLIRVSELNMEKMNFWKELAKEHGLDLSNKQYRIQEIDGKYFIIEGED